MEDLIPLDETTEPEETENPVAPELQPFFDRSTGQPGIKPNVTWDHYRATKAANASTLKQPTPQEMKAQMDGKFNPLKFSLQFGSLVHKAILEPDDFDSDKRDQWMILLEGKSLKTVEARKLHKEHPEMILATTSMVEKAARAKEAVYRHKQAAWLMSQPRDAELSIRSWDEECAVWKKGRFDIAPLDHSAGWIADIKTTSASVADLWALNREIWKWSYDFSARFYTEMWREVTGHDIDTFVFIWLQGPWAEYAEPDDAPAICRLQSIGRDADEDHPVNLLSPAPRIRAQLGKFVNAAHTDDWEAWENESVPIGRPI